jgi:integrase
MGLFKRPNKDGPATWCIQYFANGKRVREAIGPSKREAEIVLGKRKTAIREGKFFDVRKETNIAFGPLCDRYLKEHAALHKKPRSYLRNEASTLVPLPSDVVAMLQQRPAPIREWFPGWNLGRLTHAFVVLVRKTELASTGVSFHTLRHTFASHAVMNGVDLFTVGKLLGHKTSQQTQRYAHLAPDHVRSAVEQTARALFAPDVPRQVPHETRQSA